MAAQGVWLLHHVRGGPVATATASADGVWVWACKGAGACCLRVCRVRRLTGSRFGVFALRGTAHVWLTQRQHALGCAFAGVPVRAACACVACCFVRRREDKCGAFMETVANCLDNPAVKDDMCAAHLQAMLQCGKAHGARFVFHHGKAVALASGDVKTLPRKYIPADVRRQMELAQGAEEVRGWRWWRVGVHLVPRTGVGHCMRGYAVARMRNVAPRPPLTGFPLTPCHPPVH